MKSLHTAKSAPTRIRKLPSDQVSLAVETSLSPEITPSMRCSSRRTLQPWRLTHQRGSYDHPNHMKTIPVPSLAQSEWTQDQSRTNKVHANHRRGLHIQTRPLGSLRMIVELWYEPYLSAYETAKFRHVLQFAHGAQSILSLSPGSHDKKVIF